MLLSVAFLLFLTACSGGRGRTVQYDGFTVRTEKQRTSNEEAAETPAARTADTSEQTDYVLNKSSKKFHLPSCSGVNDIKDANRLDYHGTRESVIDMGFSPCRICNP